MGDKLHSLRHQWYVDRNRAHLLLRKEYNYVKRARGGGEWLGSWLEQQKSPQPTVFSSFINTTRATQLKLDVFLTHVPRIEIFPIRLWQLSLDCLLFCVFFFPQQWNIMTTLLDLKSSVLRQVQRSQSLRSRREPPPPTASSPLTHCPEPLPRRWVRGSLFITGSSSVVTMRSTFDGVQEHNQTPVTGLTVF